MPLVSSVELLRAAQQGGYALGAFNIENMEMAQAVVRAAEAMKAPVIIQTTAGTLDYAPPALLAAMVKALAGVAAVPMALHLDHGNSLDLVSQAVAVGYTSVMIDGSALPFEENITLSHQAVVLADPVPVEAELGSVGGKEDNHTGTSAYTDPAQAAAFVARTGIAALAVAIGTAHGVYQGVPKLDIERLKAIRSAVSLPLVLHGASGVPEEAVKACIALGICKVNYATELRQAYTQGVRSALAAHPEAFDPKLYGRAGGQAVEAVVRQRIVVCGSAGRA